MLTTLKLKAVILIEILLLALCVPGASFAQNSQGLGFVPNAPVIALATATTGGTIPDGTSYRLALTYVTPDAGETTITSTQEATQTTSGGGLSTITATAPIKAAGAAGYRVYSTNASGVGNSNTTLTELSQPITTAVCAGAFQVNGPGQAGTTNFLNGTGTGPWVCPFGTNAVFTSLVFTAATAQTPNIPGAPAVLNGGLAIPSTNTAAFNPLTPQMVCNFAPMTARTTVTTIQTMGSCPMQAGLQNRIGKVLHVTGHGLYTSASQTGTMTISLTEGGQTPIAVLSAALTTGGQTSAQFSFDYYVTTASTGTAGTVEAHGLLFLQGASAANGTAMIVYADTNTGTATAFDLTASNTLAMTVTMSSSTTSVTLRDAQAVLMN